MRFCSAATATSLLLAAPAWSAPAWRGSGGAAGAYENGRALLELACEGSRLRLSAFSPGTGGRGASLVVEVGGTAFLLDAGATNPDSLSAVVPASRAGLLVAALRKGKAAEVRVPAGRYSVPLAGSGAALAPLAAACAPANPAG